MSRKPAKKMISAPVKKLPTAKKAAAPKFHNQSEKGEEIGIDAGGGDHPNNFIKQPFAAGSNCPC